MSMRLWLVSFEPFAEARYAVVRADDADEAKSLVGWTGASVSVLPFDGPPQVLWSVEHDFESSYGEDL